MMTYPLSVSVTHGRAPFLGLRPPITFHNSRYNLEIDHDEGKKESQQNRFLSCPAQCRFVEVVAAVTWT
jgi:hypothetical protein